MQITIIGGAGVRTVNFINGLLDRCEKLHIDKVVLFDINKEKLEIIASLCRYVVRKNNKNLLVEQKHDAHEAVLGADYIVTTLRVGGDHARVMDEKIALDHGVIGQETTGVGGFSMAVRTIPALLEYCKMFSETAPDAWIFNFTNPSGLVTQALRDAGYDRVIGICDAPSSTKRRMADTLGVEQDKLYTEFFGLNHLSWIRSVKLDGKELLPSLLHDKSFLASVQEFSMFDDEAFDLTGYLPNEYLYYYYHREKALKNITTSGTTRGQVIEELNKKMFEELKKMDIESDPEEALQTFLYYIYMREYSYMSVETGDKERKTPVKGNLEVPSGMGYAGVMLDCIEGMQSQEGKYLVLSVPGKGAVRGFADTDVLELTCRVSKDGIVPVQIGDIPEHCRMYMKLIKAYENKTAEALRTGSRTLAVDALTMHPLVNSFSLAKELLAEYEKEYGRMV